MKRLVVRLLFAVGLLALVLLLPTATIKTNQLEIKIGSASIVYATETPDYTCNGSADDVEFQLALDALPATGGQIRILAGTYTFAATVTRAIPAVTISGAGKNTIINFNATTALFRAGGNNWTFKDFTTDAGGIDVSTTTGWAFFNITIGSTYFSTMYLANTVNLGSASSEVYNMYLGTGKLYFGLAQDADISRIGADVVGLGTGDQLWLTGSDDTTQLFSTRLTGDTWNPFGIGARGWLSWGSGGAAGDVELSRHSAGKLLMSAASPSAVSDFIIRETSDATKLAAGNQVSGITVSGVEADTELASLLAVKETRFALKVSQSGGGSLRPLTFEMGSTEALRILTDGSIQVKSPLKILEAGGTPTLYGIFSVADLTTGDKTYTFPNATGTVVTTGNLTDITATGTIASGTWQGTTIKQPYVAIATTVGDANTLTLHDFLTGTPTTNYIPKWNGTDWTWAVDATGAGGGTAGALGASAWVVSSNAPATIIAFATVCQSAGYPVWVCDGTADEVQLQAANNLACHTIYVCFVRPIIEMLKSSRRITYELFFLLQFY